MGINCGFSSEDILRETPILPFWRRYVSIGFRSTLAALIVKHTPSGIRMMAESSSRMDPLMAKEKGDPGRKELFRSPSIFSEGFSLSI